MSYRRDDSRHAAGRLLDRLRHTYKPHQLFMDVDNIAPGLDFVKVLSQQVAACDVMLVVIGPHWLDARDAAGVRRLDNARDFVRLEVEAALVRGVRVIPVLVDGATIPREDDLPKTLHPLVRRQSVRLTHERFGSEVDNLVQSLRGLVPPARMLWWGGRLDTDASVQTAVASSVSKVAREQPAQVTHQTRTAAPGRDSTIRWATVGAATAVVAATVAFYLLYPGTRQGPTGPSASSEKSPDDSAQAKKPETAGQAKKPETTGQAKKPETTGQAKKPEAPGHAKKTEAAGQAKKAEAAGQASQEASTNGGRDAKPDWTGRVTASPPPGAGSPDNPMIQERTEGQ